jgi:hypothetical protein
MARPILRTENSTKRLDAVGRTQLTASVRSASARLRQPRSKSYLELVSCLDVGSHVADPKTMKELIQAVAQEFSEIEASELPLGFVAPCRLGCPYEVHICDLGGGIIEHYERTRPMPWAFERGRRLALNPSYVMVEVYATCVRAVALDGSISVLED